MVVSDIDWLGELLAVSETVSVSEIDAQEEDEAVRLSDDEPVIVLDTVDDLVIYEAETVGVIVDEIVKLFDIVYSVV